MVDSGRCSVIIRGNSLDFNDIAKNIAIKPSQIIRRGEKSSKFGTLNPYDIWIYDVVYENNEINKTLENLLIMNILLVCHMMLMYLYDATFSQIMQGLAGAFIQNYCEN